MEEIILYQLISKFHFVEICSTGPQRNMPGTVFHDEIVTTLLTDLCDTFTVILSLLSLHAEI